MSFKKRGPYWPDDVVQAARDLVIAGWRPTEIHWELREQFNTSQVPPLSTVQRWCRGWRFSDDSGKWRLIDGHTQNTKLVLDALRDLVICSEGRVASLSNAEARTLGWLRSIHPGLSSVACWYLSRHYLHRDAHSESTEDLDIFLAFSPWKGEPEWRTYRHTLESTGIPHAPATLTRMAQYQATNEVNGLATCRVQEHGGFKWITKFTFMPEGRPEGEKPRGGGR